MNKRKKVSETLRRLSKNLSAVACLPRFPYWYNLAAKKEQLEDAKRLNALANKNDRGTLTTEEAREICDILGDSKPIVCSFEGACWAEIDK